MTTSRICSLTVISACLLCPCVRGGVQGYYRFPAIHGGTVVFAAEGDLWRVAVEGGLAMRLTTHPGNELFVKISPGGKQIAFSGEYAGNRDVYVMPITGGEPRRLTYHPRHDEVVAWRDRRTIVFRSNRNSFSWSGYNLFEVKAAGSQPSEIRIGPAVLASFDDGGSTIAFNRFSREFRNWKRYYGGRAQDVWVGDLKKNEFRKVTDWKGTDRFPMWHRGKIYFASDRSGTMNVYRMNPDGSGVEAVTRHEDYDVRWPDLHRNHIVYMLGGELWLVKTDGSEPRRIPIEIPSDRVRNRPRFEEANDTLESYALDREGKTIALASRGEVWVTRCRNGRKVQLTRSSGIRERAPAFSPDGEQVACITDQTGEQEIALVATDGKSTPVVITSGGKGWIFPPVWSPDGRRLAYADLTMALHVVEIDDRSATLVDRSDAAEIRQYVFSPDGKWLAYSKPMRRDFDSIYLYSVEERHTTPVTTEFTKDFSPCWDPKGRYLYFLSQRTINPLHGDIDYQYIVTRTVKPYAVVLAKDGKSPFLPEELQEPSEDGGDGDRGDDDDRGDGDRKRENSKDDGADDSGAGKTDTTRRALPEVRVDLDGIRSRVVEFPVNADDYRRLRSSPKKVLYLRRPARGRVGLFDKDAAPALLAYDLKDRKQSIVVPKLSGYTLSGDGKRIAYRVEDDEPILVRDLDGRGDDDKKVDKVSPSSLPLRVTPSEEWAQIFREAWRLQRDFYWAENMANVDWEAVRVRYERLLPRIGTRDELNDLIGQTIAELGTSHTYVFRGDVRRAKSVSVGLLGAIVELDPEAGRHRFERVLRPELWETDVPSPLTRNDVDVRDGEFLLAVNGVELTPEDNFFAHLANLAGEQVQLTVSRRADGGDARDVQIETLRDERRLLLRDWCRRNREYIDEKTKGRAGYIHLPDMSAAGLVEFTKAFYPQVNKECLVIDVRYNGGGNVSQLVIDRLSRELFAYMSPRRGQRITYPAFVHIGHKVVLTNQNAGSDGDIFPESFQVLKLGPVIGMRSWGGVVGIRMDKAFIDGGMSSQPEFAWWHPAKGWGLENRGVEPDIEVDILPEDWAAGRDPQLDRAVLELERMLRESPVEHAPKPPYPDKS